MINQKTVKLDLIDKKILTVLLGNSRINLTELSKIINHNYPTVRDRVGKLIDKGVITDFHPVVQFPGIGLRRYMSIYMTIKNVDIEKMQNLIKKLCENPFITQVLELEGKWNISLFLTTNFIREAYDTICWVQEVCGNNLADLIVMPTFTISNLNRKFFLDTKYEPNWKSMKTGYYPLFKKEGEIVHLGQPIKLTQEDFNILNYLKINGRDSLGEISEAIGIDHQTIDYKIKKYLQESLITYFTIEIDSEKIGYNKHLLFLNLGGSKEAKTKIIEDLKKIPEAYHYYEYLNYWELVITFCVKDQQHLKEIISNLQKKYSGSIKNHESMWIVKKHKNIHYPNVDLVYPKK